MSTTYAIEKYKDWMAEKKVDFELIWQGKDKTFAGRLIGFTSYPVYAKDVDTAMSLFFNTHAKETVILVRGYGGIEQVEIPDFFERHSDSRVKTDEEVKHAGQNIAKRAKGDCDHQDKTDSPEIGGS